MRTVLLGDLVAAARALMALPAGEHETTIARMLEQTHIAHSVFKRLGTPHPIWGDGSLMARAAAMAQRREPFASDPAYLGALRTVIEALLRHRAWQSRVVLDADAWPVPRPTNVVEFRKTKEGRYG